MRNDLEEKFKGGKKSAIKLASARENSVWKKND